MLDVDLIVFSGLMLLPVIRVIILTYKVLYSYTFNARVNGAIFGSFYSCKTTASPEKSDPFTEILNSNDLIGRVEATFQPPY